jgi:tRNA pseudouridine38-40 synthase
LQRYFLEIAYNGKNYHGWQRQENAASVQETIEKGLSRLLRNTEILYSAGRTDRGVHAESSFAHFDTDMVIPENFLYKINSMVPEDISIKNIYQPIDNDLHARFSAISRKYIYRCIRYKSPFHTQTHWMCRWQMDLEIMQLCCEIIKNQKDFGTFRKKYGNSKTDICSIKEAYWEDCGDFLYFHIRADRFLRGMVRMITGTIVEAGRGKFNLETFEKIVQSLDVNQASSAAPAHGLYLQKVEYPPNSLILLQDN